MILYTARVRRHSIPELRKFGFLYAQQSTERVMIADLRNILLVGLLWQAQRFKTEKRYSTWQGGYRE